MEKCRVIVSFELREEAVPDFKGILEKSTPKTLAEKGCLMAGMYQDIENPTHFRCIEDWESYEDLMEHLHSGRKPDPDDANPYIMANMVGKDEFHYFREVVVMEKEDGENDGGPYMEKNK